MHDPAAAVKRLLALNLAVALAYALTGYAGLQLAFVGEVVTLFWPPSGIAFAAIWLGGRRLLPGVFAGALAVNMLAFGVSPAAVLVATGNTLQALFSYTLLRRGKAAGELQTVLWFIAVAVLLAPVLSASIGTLAVAGIGVPAGSTLLSTWIVWWLGDAMGLLVVAPPIVLARRWLDERWTPARALELAAFAVAAAGTMVAFLTVQDPIWALELCKLLTLLLSLWAGARFGLHGAATMSLVMAVGAAAVTAAGAGPFVRGNFYDSFALLHSYLSAQAVAAMLLAAALADLKRTVDAERDARGRAENAAAGRFYLLTTISHDVRTPLNGILGVLQTLQRAPLAMAQARLVELGLRAGDTLSGLVTDILDAARLESGQLVIRAAPFDPATSLDDIVRLNHGAATAKGLALRLESGGGLPRLVGDRVRFEQLIGNLVANAVAYTNSGEVCLTAEWAAGAGRLTVEVSDSGPGIDPELVPRMFDAFVQGPHARDPGRAAGLGLGLDICRRLSTAMGGSLGYSARSEGGSSFRLELPFEIAGEVPRPSTATSEPALSILLVEDDPISQEVTAALLRELGHAVKLAADEDGAVACAAAERFDLILMDLHLPKHAGGGTGSGLAAARRIRLLPGADAVRIAALTADAFDLQHDGYRAAGLDAVLVKPLAIANGIAAALREAGLVKVP